MGRANVDREVQRLDALSRTRALNAGESRVLEILVGAQRTYARLARNARDVTARLAAEMPRDAAATPPGLPKPDAAGALPPAASLARPIGPLCSGHSTTLEDGA